MSEAKFISLQNNLFTAFGMEEFEKVHSLIDQARVEYPERLDKTCFWRACAYAVQGKKTLAISALEEGLSNGVWWNSFTLTHDPDLKSLHERDDFKRIVNKCEDILQTRNHNSESQLYIYGNEKADIGIFSLHWRGSNVKDFATYWFDNDLLNNYLFGFLQSSQVYGYNAYCWDNSNIALEEICESFMDYKGKYHTQQDLLAGASQGGKLAMELCLKNTLGVKGFISVIPAIKDVFAFENLIKNEDKENIKGCIITGDKDPFYQQTLELVALFEEYNIPVKLIVIEGLGHFFPNNFTSLVKEAVDFIL
ncbi:TPR end-of-group domain-containing protein [Ornithinibacillus salinisoli]|uniref:TPR end-of-group domain-containing protein n=1 Tax=Ornithinibacillus salinisoli TaxID=1848459 RepID=A0ABW4W121_9BACI